MDKDYKPYNISYVFYVQSPEDFYRQLYEFAEKHYEENDVEDTNLAKEMLQAIGVNV